MVVSINNRMPRGLQRILTYQLSRFTSAGNLSFYAPASIVDILFSRLALINPSFSNSQTLRPDRGPLLTELSYTLLRGASIESSYRRGRRPTIYQKLQHRLPELR